MLVLFAGLSGFNDVLSRWGDGLSSKLIGLAFKSALTSQRPAASSLTSTAPSDTLQITVMQSPTPDSQSLPCKAASGPSEPEDAIDGSQKGADAPAVGVSTALDDTPDSSSSGFSSDSEGMLHHIMPVMVSMPVYGIVFDMLIGTLGMGGSCTGQSRASCCQCYVVAPGSACHQQYVFVLF